MSNTKYGKYLVRGPKPFETNEVLRRYTACLDDDVVKGSFFFNSAFMEPKYSTGIHGPHTHPYAEALLFHGLNPDYPDELGWEVELHMGPEFETHTINKTTIIYCPPRFAHCPIISRMKQPAFHIYTMTGPLLVRDDYETFIKQEGVFERKYGKYFVSGPKPGETRSAYKKYTTYLDDDVIKGSFHFATTFIYNTVLPIEHDVHTHSYGEVLGFFGNNPDNQFDLGAEIEICLGEESEKHTFNQSTVVYIPPGLVHGPVKCKQINRPFIFVECSDGPNLVEKAYKPS